jgi:transient receptor potential cation channel subfamily M protein 2
MEAISIRDATVAYFQIFWNVLDVLAIILFYIGFGLRFFPVAQCYCIARTVLAIDLTLWYIRTLEIFAAFKQLGPKLVMISEMVDK